MFFKKNDLETCQPHIQLVQGVKWLGGEADHMPSSSVTVNSVCGAVPLSPYSFMVFALTTLSFARAGQVSVSPSLESGVT